MKRTLPLLVLAGLLFASCGNDDNNFEVVPPRLLAEVAPENDDEIREYLQTHFYNYEEFANPPVDFDFRIVLDTIAGDNADKIPLIDQVESAVIDINSFEFALENVEEDIPHTYYYLVAREGEGVNPAVADSAFVRYQGSLLNGEVFDGAINSAVWFDLSRIQAPLQGFRGFSEAMVNFKTGGAPITNPDGTFSVEEYGIGAMFLPSGLGGFNGFQGGIPQYSPLIFVIDLFTINPTDHDGDGIPSIMEDYNGNGYLYDDNADEDEERRLGFQAAADFLDADDDGDGTLTIDEITVDANGVVILPFPDSDGDGTPDHLDPDTN